jgi:hypothetical protein
MQMAVHLRQNIDHKLKQCNYTGTIFDTNLYRSHLQNKHPSLTRGHDDETPAHCFIAASA